MRYGSRVEPHDGCPERERIIVVRAVGTVVAGVCGNAGSVIVNVDQLSLLIGATRSLVVASRSCVTALS